MMAESQHRNRLNYSAVARKLQRVCHRFRMGLRWHRFVYKLRSYCHEVFHLDAPPFLRYLQMSSASAFCKIAFTYFYINLVKWDHILRDESAITGKWVTLPEF